ncbi:hypothetical protein JTE90_003681 [Oedothorax gibbosus]|uniref:Uncharacterized protein n=1 Tax=Oedothorax gibbosus TaxID=931172 RepID=A0AAV6VU66_9ARAC|nr:hypothetical protein JTE90_003681 [Oedothorax gibbosus]
MVAFSLAEMLHLVSHSTFPEFCGALIREITGKRAERGKLLNFQPLNWAQCEPVFTQRCRWPTGVSHSRGRGVGIPLFRSFTPVVTWRQVTSGRYADSPDSNVALDYFRKRSVHFSD